MAGLFSDRGVMVKKYPFCTNSRRWITVPFFMKLPKSCPYREEQDCQDEQCVYFELREPNRYLLYMIMIWKRWLGEGDIIQAYEEEKHDTDS